MRPCPPAIIFAALFFVPALPAQVAHERDQEIQWSGDPATTVVIRNGKFGIIENGAEVIPVKYEIENFMGAINWDGDAYYSDGAHFALGADGKWGVLDNHGNTIVPFEYDYISMVRQYPTDKMEYAGVEKNGKCAIMNSSGMLITGFEFDAFYGMYNNAGMLNSGNTMAVLKDGKIRFFDPQAKQLLSEAPKLEFTPEVRIVSYKMKMGAISRKGEVLLPVVYDAVGSATYTYYSEPAQPLVAFKNDSCGLWWPGKGFVTPFAYNSIRVDYAGSTPYAIVLQGRKYALFSGEGKQLTEFIYDSISISSPGITAAKDGKEYTLAPDGKATLKE